MIKKTSKTKGANIVISSGVRDFGFTFGSKIVLLIVSIGTQSCLAWALGPSGRGSYAVCLLFMTLLSLVFVVGCDYAGIYFVASKKLSISEAVIYTSILGVIGSVLAIVGGLMVIQLPMSFLSKASSTGFHLSLVLIPISVFSYAFLRLLTAMQQFGWFAIFSITETLANFLFTIIFMLIFSWGFEGALCANIISGIFNIIITLTFLNLKFKLKWKRPSWKSMWGMFLYDVRHYIGKLSSQINFRVGTILLAIFATQEEIGLFTVAVTLSTRIIMVSDTLSTVLIPKVAVDDNGRKELIAKCARLAGVICGAVLIILVILARPIVIMLFSSAFLPAINIIRILSIGVLVRCACKVFVPYLLGTNRPGIVSIAVVIGITVNLILLWLLLPIIGLAGAAVAMVTSFFVMSTILTVSFSRFSGLGLFEIFHFRRSDWTVLGGAIRHIRRKFAFALSGNN